MMDLEGLKAWLPGRTTGFAALAAAVDAERYFEREASQCDGLPLFPVTSVGSWPGRRTSVTRSVSFAAAESPRREFDRVADAAVIDLLRLQEEIGCDIVTDGELRRDNFYSFVADKLDGVQLHDAGRDARRRRGQGRLRAAAPDTRRAGVFNQQPDVRRVALRDASRWRSTTCAFVESAHESARSRSRCPGPTS